MMKQKNKSLWPLMGLPGLVWYAVLGILSPVVSALFALSLQPIVDAGLSGDMAQFGQACLLAVLLAAADLLFMYGVQYSRAILVNRSTRLLSQAYFGYILRQQPWAFFAKDSSVFLSKMTTEAPQIASDYVGSTLDLYRGVCSLVASLALLTTAGWELALLVLMGSLISVYLPKCLQHRSTQTQQRYLETNRAHLAFLREGLDNFLLIRLYNLFSMQQKACRHYAEQVEQTHNHHQRIGLTMDMLAGAISQGSFLAILAGAMFLVIQGTISVGYTMSLTQLLGGVMAPFELLPGYCMARRTGKTLYLETRNHLRKTLDHSGKKDLSSAPMRLSLENVSFSYANSPIHIKNLTLCVERGKKYAVVGESGCGKSTLVKLLMGFFTPGSGEVLVDHTPLSQITPASYYSYVGYQGQTATFFHDTLEQNILLGRSIEAGQWQALLKRVKLDEWIERLPNKAHTYIEEQGKNLSGGQAQRVALARCLVGQPAFLMLDEITSALDPQTASELERTILSLDDVGLVCITHRMQEENMRLYDKILMMQNGTIVEQGTWEELIKKKGKFFYLAQQDENIKS